MALRRSDRLAAIASSKRGRVSLAEETLGIPYLSQRSIMSYLRQTEALPLRAASRTCRDAVAEHAWDDSDPDCHAEGDFEELGLIRGSLAAWRRCFPCARAADLSGNATSDEGMASLRGVERVWLRSCHMTDAGLAHLHAARELDVSACMSISDAGLAHLGACRSLSIAFCSQITDAGLAHLGGLHTLSIAGCGEGLTDAGLAHLTRLTTLDMSYCEHITDAGLAHLRGIHTLNMSWCHNPALTGAGLAHLVQAHTLDLSGSTQVLAEHDLAHLPPSVLHLNLSHMGDALTNAALAPLAGVRTLDLRGCRLIDGEGMASLVSVRKLWLEGTLVGEEEVAELRAAGAVVVV